MKRKFLFSTVFLFATYAALAQTKKQPVPPPPPPPEVLVEKPAPPPPPPPKSASKQRLHAVPKEKRTVLPVPPVPVQDVEVPDSTSAPQ